MIAQKAKGENGAIKEHRATIEITFILDYGAFDEATEWFLDECLGSFWHQARPVGILARLNWRGLFFVCLVGLKPCGSRAGIS